jgi:uncharacterized protein (TIGR00296 family)
MNRRSTDSELGVLHNDNKIQSDDKSNNNSTMKELETISISSTTNSSATVTPDSTTHPKDDSIYSYGTEKGEIEKETVFVLQATEDMCFHCFDVLLQALLQDAAPQQDTGISFLDDASITSTPQCLLKEKIEQKYEGVECPLFVTWDKQYSHGGSVTRHLRGTTTHNNANARFDLRGCVGTLTPKPLATALGEYAILSAQRDGRFDPVRLSELPSLRVGVSLLIDYETADSVHDWTVGVHGIIIRFSDAAVIDEPDEGNHHSDNPRNSKLPKRGYHREYSATFLPEVAEAQGWDQRQTVLSLIRKAGYHGPIHDRLLQRIRCTRYKSSKYSTSFDRFVRHHRGYEEGDAHKFLWEQQQQHRRRKRAANDHSLSSTSCGIM